MLLLLLLLLPGEVHSSLREYFVQGKCGRALREHVYVCGVTQGVYSLQVRVGIGASKNCNGSCLVEAVKYRQILASYPEVKWRIHVHNSP